MKFKKVPDSTFKNIQINPCTWDNDVEPNKKFRVISDEDANIQAITDSQAIYYMLRDALDNSFIGIIKSQKPISKDDDIYFVAPNGIFYKAKKETYEFIECFGANILKAEFEQIMKEDKNETWY